MIDGLKKFAAIACVLALFWLFELTTSWTRSTGQFLIILAFWLVAVLVAGIGSLWLHWKFFVKRRAKSSVFPFEDMTIEECKRAVEIMQQARGRDELWAVDKAWIKRLFFKHAPGVKPEMQMELFIAFMKSKGEDRAGLVREQLHDGPAVVLTREARRPGFDVTRDGTSWFGGFPTQPPDPLPPLLNHSFGGPMRRGESADSQRLYPIGASGRGRNGHKAFYAELEAALGPARSMNLKASLFKEALPDPKRPWNRDSLLRFLHGARISLGSSDAAEKDLQKTQASYADSIKSLTEKLAGETAEREVLQARLGTAQAALKRLDGILADFPNATRQLVEELETMEAWARSGDRWQPLTEGEQAMLAPLLEPWTVSRGLGNAHLDQTGQVHRYMSNCVDETLLAMAVAEDALFETLPEPVREAINGPWRQPYDDGPHQMFGCPNSPHAAADDNEDARLLLQLQRDDLAGFRWSGLVHFWIRPDDLAAGHWDRAYMTFEGS